MTPTTRDLAIEVTGLRKSYGQHAVLDGVDLAVDRGSVYSLLGPNGAGKTTTVRILATLTRADGGTARVAGSDIVADRAAVRRKISLTGQYTAVDAGQTGEENLRMMGRLAGLSRAEARLRSRALLDQFDLADSGRKRAGAYSGGMRRRLDLAASLMGRPEVIFLDEPTTGLDLPSRQAMWQVITGLAQAGVTIFLTTQYLEEADRLATGSRAGRREDRRRRHAPDPEGAGRRPAPGPGAGQRRRLRRHQSATRAARGASASAPP